MFKEKFDCFLESVSTKNHDLFLEFFDPEYFKQSLLPGPRLVTDFHEFIDLQKSWFLSKSGKFEYDIIFTKEFFENGLGFVRALYEMEEDKKQLYISFYFRKHNHKWYFVFNQNTQK